MMSTATKLSKFGVPLTEETKDRVLDLYKMYSWLNGIHFHVGSQGVPIQLFVDGARVSWLFIPLNSNSYTNLFEMYISYTKNS